MPYMSESSPKNWNIRHKKHFVYDFVYDDFLVNCPLFTTFAPLNIEFL